MAKKDQQLQPPIDRRKIRERLDVATDRLCLVGVRRWIAEADHIEGFVVGRSRGWLLLARLSDRIELDGWVAVRQADVQAVTLYPVKDCFEIKALRARKQWPPMAPVDVRLGSAASLLTTAAAATTLVSVFREFERPTTCWVGAVSEVAEDTLSLLEVNVAGGWARKPRHFDLDDVTRVDFGGGYEEALRLVAGPPPRATTRAAKKA